MKNYSLHEAAKVLAGVVLADLVTIVWLASAKLLPVHFLGIPVTSATLLPTVMFDLALVIILVHYGWHIGKMPRMREGSFLLVIGAIFAVVTLAHVWSLLTGNPLVILDFTMPLWLSWIGVAITAYLTYTSFILMGRAKR
jgi:hypothetical protein